ncbi:allantoinase [Agrilactobacillus composti DSM 18527 = JCM 14202]|uniref:amidohydrolase family protein n=1 Tax=Agrilactobacillus composti TaxID=398555 RepID=UPI00042E013A|nr:amidohydrolase family protein [Agrilactobacillus composti]GAF40353.1 allantoinase [Agrilactobacillus composti DSM 18527 = JCM 14202]
MTYDTVITHGQIVTPQTLVQGDLAIKAGKIVAIGQGLNTAGAEVIDARGQLVLPGMVDAHVHINEPGRSDWEDYHTGSQALAAGGTTSMVVMPLNACQLAPLKLNLTGTKPLPRGNLTLTSPFMGAWSLAT